VKSNNEILDLIFSDRGDWRTHGWFNPTCSL
jgi:hypothetical protein